MRSLHTFTGAISVLMFCLLSTGCTFFHDLQPHRLWRMNRQPATSANTAFYSVPDMSQYQYQSAQAISPAPQFSDFRANSAPPVAEPMPATEPPFASAEAGGVPPADFMDTPSADGWKPTKNSASK